MTRQRLDASLTPERRRLLERLPGWDWDPRETQWERRAEELRRFVRAQSHLPRVRSDDPQESALAHWYSRQRVMRDEGRLSVEREELLSYVMRAAFA